MTEPGSELDPFLRDRGFGQQIGFGETPAVVVVDLTSGFTDPEQPLGAPLDDVIDATQRLLAAARRGIIPTFFTSVAYDQSDLADAGVWSWKVGGLMSLRAGTPEVEIDARLDRHPDEPLIVKKYASAFFGTDLSSRLNARRVDTLVLAGCTTSGCIRATAVDGIQHGFRVIVCGDAVGDRSAPAHDQSLKDLQAKYADVVPTAVVIAYLEGLRPKAP